MENMERKWRKLFGFIIGDKLINHVNFILEVTYNGKRDGLAFLGSKLNKRVLLYLVSKCLDYWDTQINPLLK